MYSLIFRHVLARIDAERAHHLGFALLRWGMATPVAGGLMRRYLSPDQALRTELWGRSVPSPIGMAAGFDKNATAPWAIAGLGFGFVEVGTFTAQAQPGNEQPRLFRLVDDRAIINRMGFNNHGAKVAGERLRQERGRERMVLGANIGKTKVVPEAEAVADYEASAAQVAAGADYVVINVSSPNTPGLRNLQATESLRPIIQAVRASLKRAEPGRHIPLLVKIAPDLADEDIDAVSELAIDLKLDGVIATNTTISREGLSSDPEQVEALGAGGLSGPVLQQRSREVLQRLAAKLPRDIVIISVGGIDSGADVWERLKMGAHVVQAYTGFIYGGPFWVRKLHRELLAAMHRDGVNSLAQWQGKR